jgi:hypothetical protein
MFELHTTLGHALPHSRVNTCTNPHLKLIIHLNLVKHNGRELNTLWATHNLKFMPKLKLICMQIKALMQYILHRGLRYPNFQAATGNRLLKTLQTRLSYPFCRSFAGLRPPCGFSLVHLACLLELNIPPSNRFVSER